MDTDQPNLLRLLAATHFAEGLRNEDLKCLCRAARFVRMPAGTKVFQEGNMEDEVFVISAGHVRLSMLIPDRGEIAFLTAGPGDLVGWSGLISTGTMTATATTVDDCNLIALSGKRLQALCDCDQNLGYVLMKRIAQVLSQRLLATRLQLLDLFASRESAT